MYRGRPSNTLRAGVAGSPGPPGQLASDPSTASPISAGGGTWISCTPGIALRTGWFQ